jgi:hypothetical protein
MKKIITICLIVAVTFSLKAQQLSGTQEFSEFGGSRYTIVNWSVNYQIILKDNAFHIRLSNPRVSASPSSLYGNANGGGKLYSKTELGLSVWPDSDPTPYNMGLSLTIQYPDGTNHKHSASIREETFIESITQFNNLKNASPSSFKVNSVENMYYNGGGDGIVDKLIAAKNNGNANSSINSKSNNVEDDATPNYTTTKPLDNYDPNTGLYTNPMTNSSYESSYNKEYQQAELVVDVAIGIIDLFSASPEEKARKEREAAETRARIERAENLRREAAAAAAAEIAKAKAKKIQMIASRKTLSKNFPDGKTPLSYQAKEAAEVYFFTYSYQAATLEEDSPLIYISNVFSISKYGDGSWPFKSNLLANIAKTNKGLDLILSGYYESREKAEEEQQLLVNTANSYEFSVKSISYNGIKSEDNSNTSTDYWGNDTNKTNSKTSSNKNNNQASKTSANNQDFWGNPTVNDKKKAVSSTEKKQVSNETKVATDYWGNTTKSTRVMLYGFVYFQKCNSEEVQHYRKLLVDEDSYDEELKIMEAKLNEDYPNAKRIMVGSSKFEYGSGVDHMCLIKWRSGSKACGYFVHSISFGKTQKEALNNALDKKNTYADKKAAYEIVEQKYW